MEGNIIPYPLVTEELKGDVPKKILMSKYLDQYPDLKDSPFIRSFEISEWPESLSIYTTLLDKIRNLWYIWGSIDRRGGIVPEERFKELWNLLKLLSDRHSKYVRIKPTYGGIDCIWNVKFASESVSHEIYISCWGDGKYTFSPKKGYEYPEEDASYVVTRLESYTNCSLIKKF